MRILKKSLACLLVAIIAATAMFGCLVSADTVTSYEGSLYVYGNPESINLGSTDNVTFNVKVDNGEAVNPVAALVTIASELGKVTAVSVADHDGAIFTGEDLDVKIDENGVATVLIESSSLSEGYAWSYAVLDVTVAPNADLALGDYETTVSAVSETVGGATYDEIPIVYSSDFVTVSVVEPLGSASNPYVLNGNRFPPMKATYVTIAAGETIYVKAYGFAGYEVGAEFDCEISVETLTAAEELFTVTNTSGADVVDGLVKVLDPIGAMENPEVITAGDHTATVVEGSQGYYYTYTATADGTVKVTMPTDKGWVYVINNMTTYVYGDTQWSDSDPVVNPGTVEVAEGDVLEIMVNTYDPASPWTAPAGEINWNLTLEEAQTECEHKNVTYKSYKAGNASEAGSITLSCADCGEEITYEAAYNKYARAGYVGASAEAQTLFSFGAYYDKDFKRVGAADANWAEMYIIVEQTRGDEFIGSQVFTFDDVEDVTSSQMYKTYYGLAATMFADTLTATVFLYDSKNDAWYTGFQHVTSMQLVAEDMVKNNTGLAQTVWVDLLNYGAAAQLNFHVNEENLANANIDAYQGAATTPDACDFKITYTRGADPTPMFYYQFTGVVESMITLRSYIRFPSNYAGTYKDYKNGEGITAVVTWTDYRGNEQRYEAVLGSDTAGGDGLSLAPGYTDRYSFYLPIGAPDLRTNINFAVYVGDTLISTETVANFEGYVAENYDTSSEIFQNLCDAMMAFGDSVNEYLLSK